MLEKLAAGIAVFLLTRVTLRNETKQLLTASLLTSLHVLPVRDIITHDETGKLFVGGRPLNFETAQALHKAAIAMRSNFARTFVEDQVRWHAVQMGVHQNNTPEQGLYAKAALWVLQELDALYKELGEDEDEGEA